MAKKKRKEKKVRLYKKDKKTGKYSKPAGWGSP